MPDLYTHKRSVKESVRERRIPKIFLGGLVPVLVSVPVPAPIPTPMPMPMLVPVPVLGLKYCLKISVILSIWVRIVPKSTMCKENL